MSKQTKLAASPAQDKRPAAPQAAPQKTSSAPPAQATATQAQPQPTAPAGPSAERIAKRAYELFQARGSTHGGHHQDWLQAERELKLGKQ